MESEKVIANKIVNGYKDIFIYLDFIVVNELLDPEELSLAFSEFSKFYLITISDLIKNSICFFYQYNNDKAYFLNNL